MLNLTLKPGNISLKELRQVSRSPARLTLDPEAIPAIDESTKVVEQVIAEDRTVYGINTGFGLLANTRIAPEDLETLQKVSCCRMRQVSASSCQMKPFA